MLEFPAPYGYGVRDSWVTGRQIRRSEAPGSSQLRCNVGGEERRGNREKLLRLNHTNPYRNPTQVGGHKCAKAYERMIVKELGKTAAVTSG